MRLLVSMLTLATAAASAQAPVGLLSMIRGTVQIVRAGQTTPAAAHPADLIGSGDRVITGANGEAVFLYCPDPKSARLTAGGEVLFTTTALKVNKGKLADERKVGGCRLPSTLALSGASEQQVGLVKLRSLDVNLRSPSRSFINSELPKFHWLPVQNAKSYEIKVTDREEKVLFKATVTGTEVQYPQSAPKLVAGQKYWWRVTARDANDTLSDAGTYFQTLTEGQAQEFKTAEADLKKQISAAPNDNGPRILLAFLYEDNGLFEDAVHTYEDLIKRLGPSDWLKARQAALMFKIGWDKVER